MSIPDVALPRTSSRRAMIILTSVAVLLYWVSLYLYAPTLPTYVESKVDSLASVGLILSMYGLWQAIIRLPLGIVSDWVGRRKPFILVGLALGGVGAWTMAVAQGATGLLVGRAITGLAAGTWVPLVVLFSSLFPPKDAVRASALLTFIGGIGRIVATGVTGTLNNWQGYEFAFYLAAGAAVLAVFAMVPARERVQPPKAPSLGNLARLVSRPDVLLPSLISMIQQYANWAATFSFIPLLARQLGATDVSLSLLLSMNIAVVTLGNLLATAVVRYMGTRRMVYASSVLTAVGVAGAALATSLPMIFVVQVAIGLSLGIGYPVLMGLSIRDVDDGQRTTAMGFHQAVYAIGMFAGPALSGVLADAWGIRPMLLVTAAACLVVSLGASSRLAAAQAR
jgi:MFS family permease